MDTSTKIKTDVTVQKKLNQTLLSSISMLPTGDGNPETNNWKLATTSLSCGLREFQGWSSGYNIKDNSALEDNLFLLTYFSANMKKFRGPCWHFRTLSGEAVARIGVQRRLEQFLQPTVGYMCSAEEFWMDRLDTFIKTHGLGDFHRTPTFINRQYLQHRIQVGVWIWNGRHPELSAFPQFKEVE